MLIAIKTQVATLLIVILSIVIFVSCDGDSQTTKAQKPASKAAAVPAATLVDGLLDILFMERAEFYGLPTDPRRPNPQTPANLKKLTFNFCVPDTGRNAFTLVAFTSRNQRFDGTYEPLHNSWVDSETDFTDRLVYFGNLKMGKPAVTQLRAALDANPTHLFIIFYPVIKSDRLTYEVHTSNTLVETNLKELKTRTPLFSLNPSPPASEVDEEN